MIEDVVRKEANRFTDFWNQVFFDYPQLKLDRTWPSVGIIDKILFPLRTKESFNLTDYDFIKGAAAYIGIIAHNNWSRYDNVKCDLKLTGDNVKDFVLLAQDKEDEIAIYLCKSLENILKGSNKEVNFFAKDKRFFTYNENLLSPCSMGIVSGLSNLVSGKWSKYSIKEFEKNLVTAASVLAESSAEFYSNQHSGEAQGSDKNLYFPNLLIPPAGSNEPHRLSRACVSLANYITLSKLNKPQTKALLKNLCFNPDSTISNAALLVSCCLHEYSSPNWLYAISNSLGMSLTLLRPSLSIIRESFEQKDFADQSLPKETNNKKVFSKNIKDEYYLGFMPFYYLDFELDYPIPENFLYFIAWSSLEKAHDCLDNFHLFDKLSPELALQLAFLKINLGMTEEAKKTLDLHFTSTPKNKEIKFKYHELNYYIDANPEHLEEAMLTGTKDLKRLVTVGTTLSRIYLSEEKFEQVITLCNSITEQCKWSINLEINKLMALLALEKDEQIDYALKELSQYFTVNNHLFSFLKARRLSQLK